MFLSPLKALTVPVKPRRSGCTSGKWGRQIKESALNGRMPLEDELQAFERDSREHVDNVIAPALQSGAVIVLDR